jgi:hypothetical protein
MKLNKISLLNLLIVAIGIGLGVGFAGPKESKTLVSSTVWVDDDDPTCGGNSPCFQTIQAAVEAVDDTDLDGGFVYIRPGRYRENVVIKRTVSLTGIGSVYLEALDPTRPTILVSNGRESRPIKIINHLEIFGGQIGIEIVDARIEVIAGNRITGLNDSWWGGYGSLSLPRMNAGIWIERAVIVTPWGIINNEISNAAVGIFLGQGAMVSRIYQNAIQRTGLGILFQDDANVQSISTNTFSRNGNHIRVTGQGLADIVNNHMLLAELHGITVEAEGARLTIDNNLIADSGMVGIYLSCQSPSFNTPLGVGEEDPCPGQQGPSFSIVRNRIVGGQYGVILVTGQGKILHNWISENGFTTSVFKGGGLLLGQKMQVEISHNWIVNNTVGAAYSILGAYEAELCQFLERPPFEGKLTGSNNEIHDNEFRDLCPADYPWPPGFRKP